MQNFQNFTIEEISEKVEYAMLNNKTSEMLMWLKKLNEISSNNKNNNKFKIN